MSDHLSRYPYDSCISCGKIYSIMSPLFPSAALLCRMKCSIDSKLSSVKCMLWLSWDFQVNFDVSIFLCQHALGKPYCIKHSFSKLGVLHLNIKTLIQFHLHDIITLSEFLNFHFSSVTLVFYDFTPILYLNFCIVFILNYITTKLLVCSVIFYLYFLPDSAFSKDFLFVPITCIVYFNFFL